MTMRFVVLLALALLFGVGLAMGTGARADETGRDPSSPEPRGEDSAWSFVLEPYILFTTIEGDAGVGRAGDTPIDADFGDILDALELGAMIHGEAFHEAGWGFILDYGFMRLGGDDSDDGLITDSVLRQGILEAFVGHRFELEGASVDVFGGVRWWDIDIDLDLSTPAGSRDREIDWVDPVIGVKTDIDLGDPWGLHLRGDVGGFGIESDSTWSTAAGVSYRLSDGFTLKLQYRALGVDYEEGSERSRGYFSYDTITHGPLLGFAFRF